LDELATLPSWQGLFRRQKAGFSLQSGRNPYATDDYSRRGACQGDKPLHLPDELWYGLGHPGLSRTPPRFPCRAIDGFRSHFTLVPEARLGIALLNNLNQTRMNVAISNQLVDLFLGLPKENWNRFHLEQYKKEQEEVEKRAADRDCKRHPGTKPSH